MLQVTKAAFYPLIEVRAEMADNEGKPTRA